MANLRFDKFDNGNPAESAIKAKSPNVGMSAFDYSFAHCGNTLIGLFAPIDCFEVVPSEKIQMSATALLEFRNPTTRQIMNGFRVYFHSRYMRLSDCWEGAKNFIDKGRSGNIDLERPRLQWRMSSLYSATDYFAGTTNANTPMSLLNFLGLPAEYMQIYPAYNKSPLTSFEPVLAITSGSVTEEAGRTKLAEGTKYFPADCAFMYQKVWRDHYSNKNLLQNNKMWFPDNEDHFILSYNAKNCVAIIYEHENFGCEQESSSDIVGHYVFENIVGRQVKTSLVDYTVTPECNNPRTNFPVSYWNPTQPVRESWICAPNLSGIKFVQFRGDRFTTASPFPDLIRGDLPVLDSVQSVLYAKFKVADSSTVLTVNGKSTDSNFQNMALTRDGQHNAGIDWGSSSLDTQHALFVQNPLSSVTMSDIYTLETLSAFKRKMGLTSGDYNEMVEAQFGFNPRQHTRESVYIGGFYQDFAINSVTQQSESNETPLGTKAGQGISAGSGSLGSITVPDYGWIQTYMFVVPDVYYTQGKPRQYSKKSAIEMYFPLFNNLPAQAIRNDELYISGTESTDSAPFAYEPRYEEFKSRTNRVSGFMGLSHSVAAFDSARIMSRRFTSTPSFNHEFVTLVPENVDMEVFTVVDEPPFDFNVAINVRRVSPMPYIAIEGSMSSPALNA